MGKSSAEEGMGTEWDQEVVGKVDPQKRVLCLAQGFLRDKELCVLRMVNTESCTHDCALNIS